MITESTIQNPKRFDKLTVASNVEPSKIQIPTTIHVLPPAVTSRIAAGEVIERPASVVKELLENALDAGATRIAVEIAGGGLNQVRVSDDGLGMSSADLALCTLPHATSKLSSAEELEALTTLGFRGEALPSIAAVSQFSIVSRQRETPDQEASRIELSGGEPDHPQPAPAAGPCGSTVDVRDLFFNLPARKKFLKGQASEAAACTDTFLRAALTRPDVAFSLFQERREVFSVQAHVDRGLVSVNPQSASRNPQWIKACLSRAREVLGRANSEGLLEILADNSTLPETPPGYRLHGLISPPAKTRPNRSQIYLTVNGRSVKDRTLTSALLEACRHLLPAKRYPIAALYLELPCTDVDVNVHPTKQEVRFRFPGLVYSLFHHALRQAMRDVPIADCGMRIADSSAENETDHSQALPRPSKPVLPIGVPKPDLGQQKFDLWPTVAPKAPVNEPSPSPQSPHVEVETREPVTAQSAAEAPANYSGPVAAPTRQSAIRNPQSAIPFRVLGQAGGSYIVIEDDSGVKLIDQHALHERILFETFLERASRNATGESQGLLTPEILELTPVQATAFSSDPAAQELLGHLGFDVENFGPRTLAVRSIPAIFSSSSKAALVADVLDAFVEAPSGSAAPSRAALREKAVYMLSCKGAIKAGERLSMEQMGALVEQYRRLCGAHGFTCPHGRPLAKELSWEELERAVGRR